VHFDINSRLERRRRVQVLAATLLLGWLPSLGYMRLCAQSAPPNDNFANAIRLTGDSVSTTGRNTGASKEPGEPDHAYNPGGKSVWWSWTATQPGYLTVSTAGSVSTNGSELDTLLAVYTGTAITALTEVGSNDDDPFSPTLTSMITIRVTPGATYRIAVDGFAFDPDPADAGSVRLSLSFSVTPPMHPAPAWKLPDDNGQTLSSTNFSGKVILLNFWATWCGPCVVEIPGLIALHSQYASDGFSVIGISVDDPVGGAPPRALVKSFALSHQMNYPIVLSRPGSTVESDYGGIAAIPTTFIIDRENNIVTQVVGSESRSYFERLIKPLLYTNLRTEAHLSANALRISWPITQANFILESTENLLNPLWQPANASVQVEGTNRVASLATDERARFYRLRMQ